MTPRRQRMLAVGLVLVGVAVASTLALQAFQENIMFFYSPSEVLSGDVPDGKRFRLGGLVMAGSVARDEGELEVRFDVTDLDNTITVAYDGILPDLFKEGQGVIAFGVLETGGVFRADEVLAKHDENYMPPEVAEMLESKGHPGQAPDTMAN